jgi:hypothetical protein
LSNSRIEADLVDRVFNSSKPWSAWSPPLANFREALPVSAPLARPWLAIPHLAARIATIDHGFPVGIAPAWHQVDLHRLQRSAGGAIEHRGKGVADLLNLLRK